MATCTASWWKVEMQFALQLALLAKKLGKQVAINLLSNLHASKRILNECLDWRYDLRQPVDN